MKTKRIIGIGLLLGGAAVLLLVQRRLVTTEISPDPLLYLVADTQRELERMPLALTRVSVEEENRIGQELARSYRLTPVRDDKEARQIGEYVHRVGIKLTARVQRKGIQYRFLFRNDRDFVNAGALPGGQIVIGRGLLELCETEDELASILGHEIAHVDRYHAIERLQYELKSKQLGLRGVYRLAHLGVILYQAGYTKEKEEEADRVGLELMVEAGYAPQAAITVMQRFALLFERPPRAAASPVEEILQMPGRSLGAYFRSHPPARERITNFEREIRARGWSAQQATKPLEVRPIFLREQAERLEKRGLYDRAAELYRKLLERSEQDADAWAGLSLVLWKSGDLPETVRAATRALQWDADRSPIWRRLARALAQSDRGTAPERFSKILSSAKITQPKVQRRATIHLAGLRILAGENETRAREEYRKLFSTDLGAEEAAELRDEMASWLYLSGRLTNALSELELARQAYPEGGYLYLRLAWIQSELGNQADATESLRRAMRDSVTGSDRTMEAVLLWRTGKSAEAHASFRKAVEEDPVWMQRRWVEFNFNRPTAEILHKLQDAELARRKQEALRAGRTL